MSTVYMPLALAVSITFIVICTGLVLLSASVLLVSKSRKEDELAASIRVERMLQELRMTAINRLSPQVPPPPPPAGPSGKKSNSSKIFSIVKGKTDGPGKGN